MNLAATSVAAQMRLFGNTVFVFASLHVARMAVHSNFLLSKVFFIYESLIRFLLASFQIFVCSSPPSSVSASLWYEKVVQALFT
mmetsp:Transcript_18241/g.35844  ORF Transcript_18241/g.35844 Transcript_18241/m.35844 type:complete len:84 (-) Transcript_18241:109-360(-)